MSKTTTERGYGWRHQQVRERLIATHKDGTPCWWCGKPMYRDAQKNFDNATLEAEHTNDLKHHGHSDADRLMHRRCNRQRLDGRDERRPDAPGDVAEPGPPRFDWAGLG
ncbi:MAG: hypothetical protein ACTMH0_08260 [Brevibacterium linens]